MPSREQYLEAVKETEEQGKQFNEICQKAEEAIEKYYMDGEEGSAVSVCQQLLDLKGKIQETSEKLVQLEKESQENMWVNNGNQGNESNKWESKFLNKG